MMVPATYAVEKAGAKCATFGKTVIKGKTKLTCVKVTEYKWVAAPIKPALGTIYNPVLPGGKLTVKQLQFQTGAVNFDFGDEVCRENVFNDGCKYDRVLGSAVDPDSPNRWISVDLNLTNLTKKMISAVDLNYSFYMILPDGKYIESERGVIYENAPIDGTAWVDKDNSQAKKVIRGGAWYFAPWSCRSATRSYNAYDYIFGFRVVL
jgi:hypothetical protein